MSPEIQIIFVFGVFLGLLVLGMSVPFAFGIGAVLSGEIENDGWIRLTSGATLVALGLKGIERERPFDGAPALLGDRFQRLELALGQRSGVVQQAADQGRLAVIDFADDDQPDGLDLLSHGYMYPERRRRSNASSDSWSMARPARSD